LGYSLAKRYNHIKEFGSMSPDDLDDDGPSRSRETLDAGGDEDRLNDEEEDDAPEPRLDDDAPEPRLDDDDGSPADPDRSAECEAATATVRKVIADLRTNPPGTTGIRRLCHRTLVSVRYWSYLTNSCLVTVCTPPVL
jgi:hypothetical protein